MTFLTYFFGAIIFSIADILLVSVMIESKGIEYIGDMLSSVIDCFDKTYDKAIDQFIYGFDAKDREIFKLMEE